MFNVSAVLIISALSPCSKYVPDDKGCCDNPTKDVDKIERNMIVVQRGIHKHKTV